MAFKKKSKRLEGSIIYLEDNYFKSCEFGFDHKKVDYARLDTDVRGYSTEQKINKANPFILK